MERSPASGAVEEKPLPPFLDSVIKTITLLSNKELAPKDKWTQVASEVRNLGPLPVKLIQMVLPILKVQKDKTPDMEAIIDAFSEVRTGFVSAASEKVKDIVENVPSVKNGVTTVHMDQLVGSASVAEIYKAESSLLPGRELVAKVIRSDAKEKFKDGFTVLKVLVSLAKEKEGTPSPVEDSIFDLANNAFESEFNTGREIRGLQLLKTIGLKVPDVYPELSDENVIFMDYVKDAVPLSEYIKTADPKTRKKIGSEYTASLIKMLRKGVFHGDPHSGNVLIKTDKSHVWVDPSPCIAVSFSDMKRMIGLFHDVGKKDRNKIVDRFADMAPVKVTKKVLSDFKKTHKDSTDMDFYADLFKKGIIPDSKYIILAKSMAQAAGTLMELIPENKTGFDWVKLLVGSLIKSF
jgi:ubiquinone biosynthesis protein